VITPKFSYNAGAGQVDFLPTYPAVQKTPYGPLVAARHDSFTSEGDKQSLTERIDTMLDLNFTYVPQSDMAGWNAFFSWALAGNQFTYYPDHTNAAVYADYTLEDTDWKPKFLAFQYFSFQMHLRLWFGTPVYFS
jgi:hypothetical protein